MINPSEFLTVALQAALQAGHLLKKGFGSSYTISSKEGRHNLVTTYDTLAEKTISDLILSRFPSHSFLGEESGRTERGDIVWLVDPLDGTVNFAHNVPLFCVSIAVAAPDIVAAVIYQPMTDELFWAEKGKGAYCNGTQLHVSSQTTLLDAYLATGFPYTAHENPLNCVEAFSRITRLGIPTREIGSAAIDLAYTAAGRFDGYWDVLLQPWDLAAGLLIVEEAGGKVSRHDGTPCDPFQPGSVIATNGHLHTALQHEVFACNS